MVGINSSKEYFDTIKPIFQNLKKQRQESNKKKKWSELGDYHSSIYVPILNAFSHELKKMYTKQPNKVAKNLITYLVGNKDFYKIIKSKHIEIQAYNLNGTLNMPLNNILAKYKIPKVAKPTKILNIDFKKNSKTTIIFNLDNGWALSFRIHNASSKIESSLKFDINLINLPKNLFRKTLNINYNKSVI